MMILGGPEKYCSPSVKVGAYENDVINGVLAEVLLTVGSVDARWDKWDGHGTASGSGLTKTVAVVSAGVVFKAKRGRSMLG